MPLSAKELGVLARKEQKSVAKTPSKRRVKILSIGIVTFSRDQAVWGKRWLKANSLGSYSITKSGDEYHLVSNDTGFAMGPGGTTFEALRAVIPNA